MHILQSTYNDLSQNVNIQLTLFTNVMRQGQFVAVATTVV